MIGEDVKKFSGSRVMRTIAIEQKRGMSTAMRRKKLPPLPSAANGTHYGMPSADPSTNGNKGSTPVSLFDSSNAQGQT
ncbi:hypothetical protein AVEN_155597-1 [Araneus ventricosus]|uniref:Uncharacterized protein n=1 Tax=Araneus ventricosus TaxID=182803 RepID=A0A4Y2BQC4_ARAVE|nr:hypothetical protein AVEN_155597-1 [Araneus ventricosus]